MIEFKCLQCGNPFRVAEEHAGRHGWCKVCKAHVEVPMASTAGSPAFHEMNAERLRDELDALQATRAELQTRLMSAEQMAARIETIEAERLALTRRMEEAESERLRLQEQLQEALLKAESAENALSQPNAKQEDLNQTLEFERYARQEAEDALQALQIAHQEALAMNAELEGVIHQMENTAQEVDTNAAVRLDEFEETLARAEERLNVIQVRVEEMDDEIARELNDTEGLATHAEEGLNRGSEFIPAQQAFLVRAERQPSDDALPRFISAPPATSENDAARLAELVGGQPAGDQKAMAEAFLRFMQEH